MPGENVRTIIISVTDEYMTKTVKNNGLRGKTEINIMTCRIGSW